MMLALMLFSAVAASQLPAESCDGNQCLLDDDAVGNILLQVQKHFVQSGFQAQYNLSESIPAAVDAVWGCYCGGWIGADMEGTIWTDAVFDFSEVDEPPAGAPEGKYRTSVSPHSSSSDGTLFETLINADRTSHTCHYEVVPYHGHDVDVNMIVSEGSTPGVATVTWSHRIGVNSTTEADALKASHRSLYTMMAELLRSCAASK